MTMDRKYRISKVFNNNVILVTDKNSNQELVLVGKGIGFGKKDGKKVILSESDIEKSFIAYDEKTKTEYFQLISQMNSNVLGVSEEIIALAEENLGRLNSHIHIALTDHIGFALDRIKMGMEISNPFIYEIRALYPEEFRIGLMAAEIIKDRLDVEISESEIGFITLHFHSARQNKKVNETLKDTKLIKDIIELIENELSVTIDNGDLIYTRLINHLRVSIQRLDEKKYIENPLLDSIKEQFKYSFAVAGKIGEYIKKEKNVDVPDDELGYLAFHIERINETKKLMKRNVTESNKK